MAVTTTPVIEGAILPHGGGSERTLGHCPKCDRRWGGLAEAHCRACCLHFGSDSGFDRHRRDGRCMTEAQLLKPREWKGKVGKPTLVPVERKGGTYWVSSVYERES